jgi:hypothetical protein
LPKDVPDEIQEMDVESSPASELDEGNAAPEANAVPADSSAATDETETDTLSIVRDVVGDQPEEPDAAASSAEGEEDGQQADENASQEQDPEDYSDVPFNKHPRFQKLLKTAKANEQDATRYRNVESFLATHNLEANEAADVMEIAGLAKTNPVMAWEKAQKWVHDLMVGAGVILPQDLADRVTKGELTRDIALELSKARAVKTATEASAKFQEQRGQREQQVNLGRTLRDTAEGWLTNRRLKDPNFAAKEDRLKEKVVYLQSIEGVPGTADGVKAQLKKAYDAVNKDFTPPPAPANRQAAPQRRPALRPVQGGQVAASVQAAPTGKRSTVDIIKQVVGGSRAS